MKSRFAILPCLLLAACQVTTFEHPPLAAADGCDPSLVGTWDSVDADAAPGSEPEMSLAVSADCELAWTERHRDGRVETGELPLRIGGDAEATFAWVDARRALAAAGEGDRFPRGDVIVVRYRIDGDSLSIWNADDKAVAHAIIDGGLTGQVTADGGDLFNRVTGEPGPAVLYRDDFWDDEPGVLRRRAGE